MNEKDRPPLSPLSGTAGQIPEDRYRHDLALHDRFQAFGAELLRISLLGLAAFGFILVSKDKEIPAAIVLIQKSNILKIMISFSPVFFGISAACALYHRFLASDGMFHHIRAIKLIDLKNPELDKKIRREERRRNKKFKRAEKCLHYSAVALGAGAALLALSYVWILIQME